MNYTLDTDERSGYLYARVHADAIDRESARAYLSEIAARVNETGAKALMIYRDIPAVLDSESMGDVIPEFIAKIPGVRTAIVNPHIENTPAMNAAVTVGRDRGADYQAFSDVSDAEAWLLT